MTGGDGGFVEFGAPEDLVYVDPDQVRHLSELEEGGTRLHFSSIHTVSVPQPPGEVLSRFEGVA